MSTRTRTRSTGKSYTARLQQRAATPRPPRHLPAWLITPALPALVALGAELGHLAAALPEWPAAPLRGLLHVLAAASLGLLAATVYFGTSRRVLVAGIALALIIPCGWLTSALAGAPLYQESPLVVSLATTILEIALAGLLAAPWRTVVRR